MLQGAHLFDAVLEPGLSLVRGHQPGQEEPGQGREERTSGNDEAILISRADARFREDVVHADKLDTAAHHLVDEPRLVHFLDGGDDLDFVAGVSSQILAQGDLRSGAA